MEDDDILAEKLENVGADISIEDNNGNFVGSKNDNENIQSTDNQKQNQKQSKFESESESVSVSVPIQNIYNVFNLIVQKPDLSSLGINDISEPDTNEQNYINLNTDDFMREIKDKIGNSLNKNYQDNNLNDDSSSSSEYVDLPEIESSVSSMNTDNFITLLDENKNPSFFNYSDIQDTDQFISILRDKYSSQTNDNNKKNKPTNNIIPNQNKSSNPIINLKNNNANANANANANTNTNTNANANANANANVNQINKPTNNQIINKIDSNTSDMESSVNTQMIKLENESTSDNFISNNSKPNNSKPNNSKPNNVTSNNIIYDNAKLNNITSDNFKPNNVTSDNAKLNNVTSDNAKLNNVTSDNAKLNNITSDNVTSDNVISDNVISDNVTSDNVTSDNVTSDNKKSNQNNLSKLENSETNIINVNSLNPNLLKLGDQTTSDNYINPQDFNKQTNENIQSSNTLRNIINDNSDKLQTSNIPESINNKQKLNSKANIFVKNNKLDNQLKNLSSSDIDTNTLFKAIKKIQNNYDNENDIDNNLMKGGTSKKQQIMGYRNLNSDSDISFVNSKKNKTSNTDYNKLYNSDSEYGTVSNKNELKRMISRQKESLHHEVLEMIMGMLNKGLLLQSNKPIEASEKNAKLVKAYIYRQISEKNPEMGGMDKILSIKTMNENEIINIVKKIPSLDELEENIKKHLEEKNKNIKNIDTSEALDISESEKETKTTKKGSKKSEKEIKTKTTKKDSKKSSKK